MSTEIASIKLPCRCGGLAEVKRIEGNLVTYEITCECGRSRSFSNRDERLADEVFAKELIPEWIKQCM